MSLVCESIARMAFKQSRRMVVERRLQVRPRTTRNAIASLNAKLWEQQHAERIVSMANEIIRRKVLAI